MQRSCGVAWKRAGCTLGVGLSRVLLAREAVGFTCTELEGTFFASQLHVVSTLHQFEKLWMSKKFGFSSKLNCTFLVKHVQARVTFHVLV